MTLGFEVFVQLVIAATTTDPCVSASNPGGTSAVATAGSDLEMTVFSSFGVPELAALGSDPEELEEPVNSRSDPFLRSASMTSSACSNFSLA
jgi:hypothetical protein